MIFKIFSVNEGGSKKFIRFNFYQINNCKWNSGVQYTIRRLHANKNIFYWRSFAQPE